MADDKKTETAEPQKTGAADQIPATMSAAEKKDVVEAQAGYTGNEHSDLVEVTIIKDGNHYKKGDTDIVHPSLALILEKKGLVKGTGKPYTRPKFDQKDITIDV